jgi:hypothetical protein
MRTIDNFGRVLEEDAVERHIQSSPSSEWRIEHNRGREIIGKMFNQAGEEITPDEDQSDLNVCVLRFLSLETGVFTYK